MPNPKLAEQVAEVLGHAPDDAQLLLPRDGQQWLQNQMGGGRRKTSIGAAIAAVMSSECPARPRVRSFSRSHRPSSSC
jgi:hypothetical protein